MTQKHTPAPWSIKQGEYHRYIQCSRGYPIHVDEVKGKREQEFTANAHLIAAAPELLEALKALLKEYQSLDAYRETVDAEVAAEYAIAKAEGK